MNINGLGVAMITPFNDDLSVDVNGLRSLTERLISDGVDFLVVMGTTGESVTLNTEERRMCLDTVLDVNNGRVPVIYGMGGNNTAQLCADLEALDSEGLDGILSASPSYNKPTQEGIYQHYKAIGAASPLPIILYNVPGRTGSNVEAATCIRIANDVEAVKAVKEASGDIDQIMEILAGVDKDFLVFSGDDGLTIPVLKAGGKGIISVIGNGMPELYSSIVDLALTKKYDKAEELDALVQPILPLLFKEGNPAGIKALMEINGEIKSGVRLPLVPASNDLKIELELALKKALELV